MSVSTKTAVERDKGIVWLYEVIVPEMRILIPAVTIISTKDLDLGYY